MGFAEIGTFASIRGVTAYEAGLFRIMRSTQTATSGIGSSLRSINGNIFSGMGGGIAAVGNQIRNLGSLVSSVGFSMALFSAPLIGGFVQAANAGKQFEMQMVKIKNLTGLNIRDFAALKERIFDLSVELGRTPTELADSLYYIGSVGISNINDALDIMAVSSKAAAAGLGDVDVVGRTITSMMIAFQGEITSASQAADMLFAGVKEGGAEAADVVGSIGRAMASWREAGGSAEDLLTFIATYTRQGVSGAVAVTSALNIANFLIDPSEKAKEVLAGVGKSISSVRQEVQDKGLIPTLIELEKVLGSDIAKLMSVRGTTGTFVLAADAQETLRILKEIKNATGEVDAAFDDYRKTSQFAFDSAKAALQALGIELFDAFKKPLSDFIFKLTELIVKIREVVRNNPELTKLGLQLALAAAAGGPLLIILGQVMRALGSIVVLASGPLRLLGFGFGVLSLAAGKAFTIIKIGAAASLGLMGRMTAVIRTAGAAMSAMGLGVLRVINPILGLPGAIRAAGVALMAFSSNIIGYVLVGLVGLMNGFGRLTGIIRGVGSGIVAFGRDIGTVFRFAFSPITALLGVFRMIPTPLGRLRGLLASISFAVGQLVVRLRAFALIAVTAFPRLLSAFGRVTGLFTRLGGAMALMAARVAGGLRTIMFALTAPLYGIFVDLPGLMFALVPRFSAAVARLSGLFALAAGRIAAYVSHLTVMITGMMANAARAASGLLVQIGTFISGMFTAVSFVVRAVASSIVTTLGPMIQRVLASLSAMLVSIVSTVMTAAITVLATMIRVVEVASMVLGRILASTLMRVLATAVAAVASTLASLAGVLLTVAGAAASALAPVFAFGAAIAGLIVLGSYLAKGLSGAFQRVKGAADKQFGGSFANRMKAHGKNIMYSFSQGIIQGLVAVVRALQSVAKIITRWLKPGSPPKLLPDLDIWGSGALSAYMEGWTKFDFSAFTEIAGKFRSFFDSLVPSGDEGESGRLAVIERLLQFRKTMVGAINEINTTGALGASTWNTINNALSGASDEMKNFVRLTLEAALAQEKVAAAQKRIDDLKKAYDARLKPINDRLAELDRGMAAETDMERTKELQRIMKDPRASAEVKRRAQMEIESIALKSQKDIIENERDRQLEVLEQELTIAQGQYEAVQQQLEYATQLIDLQIEQNELLREMTEQKDSAEQAKKDAAGGGGGGAAADEAFPLEEFSNGMDFESMGGGLPKWEGPLGDLDGELQTLKGELVALKNDMLDLFGVAGDRVKEMWEGRIKPAIDAFIAHPFTQEVWATIKQTVTDTVENFKNALGPTDEFRGALAKFKPVVQFVGVALLALIKGVGKFIALMGGVLGTFLRFLRELMAPVSIVLTGVVELIVGIFSYLATGSEDAKVKIHAALSQIWEGLKRLGETLLLGIVQTVGNFLMALAAGILEGASTFLLYFEEMTGISTEKAREWIAGIIERIKTLTTDGGAWVRELKDRVVEKFEELKEGAKSKVNGMKADLDWLLTQIKLSFYLTWINIKADVIATATTLKNWLEETFKVDLDKIFEDIRKIVETVKDRLTEYINTVKSNFETAFAIIGTVLQTFWDKMKEIWQWLEDHVFTVRQKVEYDNSGIYGDQNSGNGNPPPGPGNPPPAQPCAPGYHRNSAGHCVPDRATPDNNQSGFNEAAGPAQPLTPLSNQIVIQASRGIFGIGNTAPVVNFGDTHVYDKMDGLELEARIKRIIMQMAI